MSNRAEAIRNFLEDHTRPDLTALYHAGMETQVNVAQCDGRRVAAKNTRAVIWTDGSNKWYSYRIPKSAWASPVDNSLLQQTYPLEQYAEGIGLTGWDFADKKSIYVAYDFDSIVGHKTGLSAEELAEVRDRAQAIPWVTVRQSTGGYGFHLYVFLDPQISTENHSEHAGLARAVLEQMSAHAGYDFSATVDTCGGNMWIWHRKLTDRGLRLIKQGEPLQQVPINWRDHISVASSRVRTRVKIGFTDEQELDALSGEFSRIPLDEVHRALIRYLDVNKAFWWFDTSRHMLVAHTYDLKQAHTALMMRGVFDTVASGKEHGSDHNCFAYPLAEGGWVVRRYTKGIPETKSWSLDRSGYQRSYLNMEPDLDLAARLQDATRNEKGDYAFSTVRDAIAALARVKVAVPALSEAYLHRAATVKLMENGVSLRVARVRSEQPPAGWTEVSGNTMAAVIEQPVTVKHEDTLATGLTVDHQIRHLVDGRQGSGWAVCTAKGTWYLEMESAVSAVLSHKFKAGVIKKIMGACILNPWLVVNMPFQAEYPGDRRWNRDSAQFRFRPPENDGEWDCPTWWRVLNHTGVGLNDAVTNDFWCQANGITTGGEYLLYWTANMFRRPEQPLPYLFLFGPQNSGKSILHQALALLFLNKVGYVRAEAALQNAAAFNGELAGAVLCVLEEVDLSGRSGKLALGRIKDYVGSDTIGLHAKGKTVILVQNTTHWIQCSNDPSYCPIFPDDSRITMSLVPSLDTGTEIPKTQLLADLEKEGPNFLGLLLSLELPDPPGRLAVPVISTTDKHEAAALNASLVSQFIEEKAHICDGHAIPIDEFFKAFCAWLGSEAAVTWTKQRISREMSMIPNVVRGRYAGPTWHYSNITFDRDATPGIRLVRDPRTESLVHAK